MGSDKNATPQASNATEEEDNDVTTRGGGVMLA